MLRTTIAAVLLASPVLAHDYTVGEITIDHPFAFAPPMGAPVAGGYMEITNAGETDDTLIAARVGAEIVRVTELHEMSMQDGVMRMSEIAGGIPVPAGETVTLKQGGLHVMFMGLETQLDVGDEVPAVLVFENAGEVEVVFNIEERGAEGGMDHSGHGHGHGSEMKDGETEMGTDS